MLLKVLQVLLLDLVLPVLLWHCLTTVLVAICLAVVVPPVQEYPDMFKGVTIGNGKIRIGLLGINKDIVLDANDIETFKQSLVK